MAAGRIGWQGGRESKTDGGYLSIISLFVFILFLINVLECV